MRDALGFAGRSRRRAAPLALGLIALGLLLACGPATAKKTGNGRLEETVVHGASLEHNLLGLSADRAVSIYLPPSYDRSKRRYPVVYLLHGIMDSNRTWTRAWDAGHPGYATIQQLMDSGIAQGLLQEMIVVVPDADKSCHYTDSPVKGGWATFVARDLVQYVDRTYHTIPGPEGRGIMGHSMGGHGTIKLAMTHPGVFGAVYAMNPSLLGWGGDASADNPQFGALATLKGPEDLAQAGFYVQAIVGIGQCFSPAPEAPLLTDLPFAAGEGGGVVPGPGHERWTKQMPLYMAPDHVAELKALRGLAFDSAFVDEFSHIPLTTRELSDVLDSLGVEHTFEMYNGDHRNRLWGADGRIFTHALPFFSRLLGDAGETGPTAGRRPAPGGRGAAPTEAAPPISKAQAKLWKAARAGDVDGAAAALKAGADVNLLDTSTTTSGRRAINYAAEHDRAEMIRWLVEHGAEVNCTNRSGFTPLHHAAESGSAAAAQALLELGTDPTAKLPSGSTPLDVARQRGKQDVVRVLARASGS